MSAPDPHAAAAALRAAAFGVDPGRHPLPPAATGEQRWLRAVALGGQGRYAAAATALDGLAGGVAHGPALRSLALSAHASHRRQVGAHGDARRLDAAALAVLGPGRSALHAQARCDALVGLAADALGPRRIPLARDLLARARPHLAAADPRCSVRWGWVAAETELWAGDAAAARPHAAAARARAGDLPSVRHRVKSDLVVAATTGDPVGARAVLDAAQAHGLVPLAWGASMLLLARARPGTPAERALWTGSTACHELLAHRGARWPRPPQPGRT